MEKSHTAEAQFYSRYDWCLNPILSVRDLIRRFNEEVVAYRTAEGWQREECKINLYLFACAIACTADDFFNGRFANFAPLYSRISRLRALLLPLERALNTSALLAKLAMNWEAWRWRKRWNAYMEEVCDLLLTGTEMRIGSEGVPEARLPQRLLNWKMRLPEAFRGQDFTHHDVVSLIQHYREANPDTDRPIILVGLRTAGAYFAPLMAAYLNRANYRHVSWFSIRPKNGISTWESRQLHKAHRQNARVLLVDDYPATGSTMRLTLKILQQAKLNPEQISLLAPTHTAQPNWVKLAGVDSAIKVFTVQPEELFKVALLKAESVESWCAEYFPSLRIVPGKQIDDLNARLAEHSKDGHHVREKRVFDIYTKKILLKSVGWGWLGYHAYIAGKRMEGFVPNVIGLRNGLLLMDWIETLPAQSHVTNERMVDVLASYVAARTSKLRLTGDFEFESRTYRWTGIDDIVTILRAAYGPYLSRMKGPRLRKELYKYVTTAPTMIDGRMHPEEWLHTADGIYKSDFEHHNFGGAEPDFADPAYDLASAIFEFELSKEHEEQLIEKYIALTGDRMLRERLVVHKMFYASMAMRHAIDRIVTGKQPDENHEIYHRARNFLIYLMCEFCAGFIKPQADLRWSDSLFFIDVDGVFDQDILGFPHATHSALQSLILLQTNGCSVVLNTGRGAQHVRKYCDVYGIQGGVAEFGSVFFDTVHKKDIPLIDDQTAAQLAKCRDALHAMPGVFLDPGYEYSIRAYRFKGRTHVGLSKEEIQTLLRNPAFDRLSCLPTGVDTYIVQAGLNKGTAVEFVKRYLKHTKPVTAIGHGDMDVPMLEAAERAYALANCSAAARNMTKQGRCRIVKRPRQSGLLWAIQHRLKTDGLLQQPGPAEHPDDLMSKILRAADRKIPLLS